MTTSTPGRPTVAVTGATGKVGRRVAALLADQGVPTILPTRRPDAVLPPPGGEVRGPAAYDDAAAMERATAGADVLLLVSAALSGRRLAEHVSAVEAARAAGVRRVVYLSLVGAHPQAAYVNARDHGHTEAWLARQDLPWTVLRAGFYASMLPGLADADGVIRAPAGGGRVAAVSHDDVAEVAAAVLLEVDGGHDWSVLEVTGPEALDLHQVADRLTAWSGRPHSYRPESVAEGEAWRRRLPGVDEDRVQTWLSWYRAIAQGEVAAVTVVVPRLTGHPARPVEASWGGGEPQAVVR